MRNSFLPFLLCCLFIGSVKEETDNNDEGYIVSVGDIAPDFQIQYQDGSTQSLTSLLGKIVYLTRFYNEQEFAQLGKTIDSLLQE
ncbi:MAG: hypothetical protein ACOYEG_06895 [Petrimonas sp.]|jgi:hypothetical protein